MLFVGEPHDGTVPRALALGALFGLVRSAKAIWKGLEVEHFDGDVAFADYAELGFHPPVDGSPRLHH
jgi:hypothetical protein